MTSQLLLLIDDMNHNTTNMVLIAATNRPNALDPAVRRPGRFDNEVSNDGYCTFLSFY